MEINLTENEEKKRGRPLKEKQNDVNETPVNKSNEQKRIPGCGLDAGTMFLVQSHYKNDKIAYVTQRDAFLDIENNMMSKTMLNKLKTSYIESQDKKNLYVMGDDALTFANFFNKECRRPFAKGVISTRESEALSMIKTLLYNLVGEPIVKDEKLFFSIPADPVDANFSNVYHENVLKTFLKSFGYDAEPINEAFAIVWSELEDDEYTGLTLSFGAGQVNVALSLLGISQKHHQFSIARSGDWIDEQSSTATGLVTSKITAIKESGVDLYNPKNREETAIKIYYDDLIRYVCTQIEKKFSSESSLGIDKPIPIIISGGTSKPLNFDKIFEKEINSKSLPFKIKEVRRASDPLNAVSKGCLLNAIMSST